MQFCATMHFHSDDACIMTWMSGTIMCSATSRLLDAILRYEFTLERRRTHLRIHNEPQKRKECLEHYYPEEPLDPFGSTNGLPSFYDSMHKLLHQCITPKVSDAIMIWGTLSNTMWHVNHSKPIDVIDFMHHELQENIEERKSCIYGPYLQALIKQVTSQALIANYPLTKHTFLQPTTTPIPIVDDKEEEGVPARRPRTKAYDDVMMMLLAQRKRKVSLDMVFVLSLTFAKQPMFVVSRTPRDPRRASIWSRKIERQ